MRSPRSLLHRLEYPRAKEARDLPGDSAEIIESVSRHLQVMLNTRQGNSQTVPDYGTTDFSDVARGYQSVRVVQEEIRRSIEKYEPRLRDIQVNFTPDEDQPFTLHFDIAATIVLEDGERTTMFQSVLESNGEVKVRPR